MQSEKIQAEKLKKYERFLQRANKNEVLRQLPDLHEEAFEKINCLDCAACCRNYSPRFKQPDIRRIARHLKIKEGELIEKYLYLDADGDFVAKTKPCPFLRSNNLCSVYEVRPSDCSRFPYTDEDVLIKRPKITLKNATFCPIVEYVMDKLTD